METYVKMMDCSFYHNRDVLSDKNVVSDITRPVFVDGLRRVCIMSNTYSATVDRVEQGKTREHHLNI